MEEHDLEPENGQEPPSPQQSPRQVDEDQTAAGKSVVEATTPSSAPPAGSPTRPLGMMAVEAMQKQRKADDDAAAEAPLAPLRKSGGMQSLTPPSRRNISDVSAADLPPMNIEDVPDTVPDETPALSRKESEDLSQPSVLDACPKEEESAPAPLPSPEVTPAFSTEENAPEIPTEASPASPTVEEASSIPSSPLGVTPVSSKEEETLPEPSSRPSLAQAASFGDDPVPSPSSIPRISPAPSNEEESVPQALSSGEVTPAPSKMEDETTASPPLSPPNLPPDSPMVEVVLPMPSPAEELPPMSPKVEETIDEPQPLVEVPAVEEPPSASPPSMSSASVALASVPSQDEPPTPNEPKAATPSPPVPMTTAELDRLAKSRGRRTSAASVRPGAVAVAASEPDPEPSAPGGQATPMTTAEQDSLATSQGRRSVEPRMGAVSVVLSNPDEPKAEIAPSPAVPATMTQHEQDMLAKSQAHGGPHSSAVGAVAIGGTVEATPPTAAPAPASMTTAEQDRLAKSRGRRSTTGGQASAPSVRPGAVSVAPSEPTPEPSAAGGQTNPLTTAEQDRLAKSQGRRSVEPRMGAVSVVLSNSDESEAEIAPSPAVPATMTQHEQDMLAKSQARGGPQPSVVGAVATGGTVEATPPAAAPAPASMTTAEQDRLAKSRGRRSTTGGPAQLGAVPVTPSPAPAPDAAVAPASMSQNEQDIMAKARARGGVSSRTVEDSVAASAVSDTAMPGAAASIPSTMTQAEQDAFLKAQGREQQPMHETENVPGLGNNLNSALSHRQMAQMDQQQSSNKSDTTIPEPEAFDFSNMTESQRQRRFDEKVAQMSRRDTECSEKSKLDQILADESNEYYGDKVADSNREKPDGQEGEGANQFSDGIAIGGDIEYGDYGQPVVHDNELAVAIAIEDDQEEEKFFAHAVEYDPESKPPIYKNRRFLMYGIGGIICFIILAVALGVAIPMLSPGEEFIFLTAAPTLAPTMPPTTPRENDFLSRLAEQATDQVLIEGTSARLAADWIMFEDPLEIEPDDPRLLQRFMMTFLYYATSSNGEVPWASCNPPQEDEDDTCTYLEFTRLLDDKVTWVPLEGRVRWLSGQDECLWEGVVCAGGDEVLGVEILGQNLTGTVPSELASLPFLQKISMPYNLLEGSIPSEFATLRYLIDIELHGNMLTGTIPEELYSSEAASDLVRLNVGENLLDGTLDTRIGLMTNLKGLHLNQNNFDGPFPTEIGELRYLAYTRVHGNEFSGPIPSQLGGLRELSEMRFEQNIFTETIPTELGNLDRMEDFRLWGNKLEGTIPEELYNMTSLSLMFALRDNSLTGTLSTRVGQLTNLVQLIVSNNTMTGTIPTEISQISGLRLAWFHLNQFSDPFPDSVCAAIAGPGRLEYLQADCFEDLSGTIPNPCACCSACCNRDTEECLLT